MPELKQLGFVDSSARNVAEVAENLYFRARGLVPGFLLNGVEYTENVVSPYYGKAQSMCQDVLLSIDEKVDYGVTKSQGILKINVVGEKGADEFKEAKNKYVTVAVDMYQFVRKNGISGTASAIVNNRGEAYESIKSTLASALGATCSGVQATFENVTSKPAVQKVVSVAKPYADAAHSKYHQLHDALIHTPQYALLYKLCNDTFVAVFSNPVVKRAVDAGNKNVYPYVQFIADPAYEHVTPYVEALKEHLQPAMSDTEAEEQLPESNPAGDPIAKPEQAKRAVEKGVGKAKDKGAGKGKGSGAAEDKADPKGSQKLV